MAEERRELMDKDKCKDKCKVQRYEIAEAGTMVEGDFGGYVKWADYLQLCNLNRRYGCTAEIFARVAWLYQSMTPFEMSREPARSAVQLYLEQGKEAIRSQVAADREEYIEKLLADIRELAANIKDLKKGSD